MKPSLNIMIEPKMKGFADLRALMAEAEHITKTSMKSLVFKTARQLVYSARDYTPISPETSTWATLQTGEDVQLPDQRWHDGEFSWRWIRGRGHARRGWMPAARHLGNMDAGLPPGPEEGGYVDKTDDWRKPLFIVWNDVEYINALEHGGSVPHLPGRTVDVVEPHNMVERAIHRAARVLEDQIQRHYRKLQKAWLSKRLA